jgi:hypothetical protein
MDRIEQFVRNRNRVERTLLMLAAAGMIFLAGTRAGEFLAYATGAA